MCSFRKKWQTVVVTVDYMNYYYDDCYYAVDIFVSAIATVVTCQFAVVGLTISRAEQPE